MIARLGKAGLQVATEKADERAPQAWAARGPIDRTPTQVVRKKRVFVTLFPEAADEFPLVFKRACGPTPGYRARLRNLNALFKRALGVGAEPYLIAGGRGTVGYRLSLPPAQIALVPQIPAAPSRGDEPGVLALVRRCLDDQPFTLIEASDGKDPLEQ